MSEKQTGGHGLLIGIIVGIVAAVVIGLAGGRRMWMATGGPIDKANEMAKIAVQKEEEFAKRRDRDALKHEEAGKKIKAELDRREAARLRSHIPLANLRELELLWIVLSDHEPHAARAADVIRKIAPIRMHYEKARDLLTEAKGAAKESKSAEVQRLVVEAAEATRKGKAAAVGLPTVNETRKELAPLIEEKILPIGGAVGFFATLAKFAGDIFLRALFMLVIPLVVASMVVGVASLGDVRHMGRTGGRTVAYYMLTTCIAVIIGILLVTAIRPGSDVDDTYALVKESAIEKESSSALDTMLNVFRGTPAKGDAGGMIPKNLFAAATKMNVLGIIFFALLFGAILTTIGEKGKPVLALFQGLNEIIMKMVHLVMYMAPVGIFGLVVGKIVSSGGGAEFGAELRRLIWYAFTVILGLLIHALVVLPLLLKFLGKRRPLQYAVGMSRALLTALSTASSAATLPLTMECAEENNGVSEKACSFVLPLGATINMDGTALYEAVAVIFIAQSLGVEMTVGHLVVIFLTATLAAIGAAGIPEAGLVTMVIVLAAVGLDTQGIGTILAIDWFLDRCRTTVNVWGDSVGAAIIDHYEEEEETGAAAAAPATA